MDLATLLLVALGLSMDAVAVSLASSCAAPTVDRRQALVLALLFGVFQALMPLAGWLAGLGFKTLISRFDHWLAFVLLVFIGGRMVLESRRGPECRLGGQRLRPATMLALAVATSIDALAVGLSFSALAVDIILPVLLIGAVTFVLSLLAALAGRRFGERLAGKAVALGGLILVAIGLKILVEHLRVG
ncbi:MAG: manganese efflux pump MntP family protein [Acidobacteria bacterium]|jgi:putative Mn2+ efflux pump MntP|nr:manganese efflux pump MntP family protein [Acidobacteriota bacterium]